MGDTEFKCNRYARMEANLVRMSHWRRLKGRYYRATTTGCYTELTLHKSSGHCLLNFYRASQVTRELICISRTPRGVWCGAARDKMRRTRLAVRRHQKAENCAIRTPNGIQGATTGSGRSESHCGRRTWEGISKSAFMTRPNMICRARAPFSSSSPLRTKGKLPSSSTYRSTPHDQMSATLPSYSPVVNTCHHNQRGAP